MRWVGRRQSQNVEDRRGISPRGVAVGGGVGGLAILVLALLMGADPTELLNQMQNVDQAPTENQVADPRSQEEPLKSFVSVVVADTEDVWRRLFQEMGMTYRDPVLVLFTGRVESACGLAGSAMGPFYCPADERVYIDLDFCEEMANRLNAPGDFAQAYVIAHEVGHHVQNLMGITERVHGMRNTLSDSEFNALSVRLELQADFLAGVWAHHAQSAAQILETGDVEEALGAASAIGDDRLQMQTQGYIVPDSFTHGTSEQRVGWFLRGLETGDVSQGDTFGASNM